jgi:ubiquinone/menaquinone biosynthesis C-methylase UbiE
MGLLWKRAQEAEKAFQKPLYAEWLSAGKKKRGFLELKRKKLFSEVLESVELNFSYFKNKELLDVGCGFQGIINFIDSAKKRVGLDPLIEEFSEKLKTEKCIEFVQGVGEKMPFESNSFDFVFCLNVLNHTAHPEEVLKEISRVLKPCGELLLWVHTFHPLVSFFNPLIALLDAPHPHHFSSKKIKQMLSKKFKTKKHVFYSKPKLYGVKGFIYQKTVNAECFLLEKK